MARPESTKRRVSHLVGRFEQLSVAKRNSNAGTHTSDYDEEVRARSHHSDISHRSKSSHAIGRKALSIASPDAALESRLAEERRRREAMQDECEVLRKRCRDDEETLETLQKKLEQSEQAWRDYEEQLKKMESKIESMRQQSTARTSTDKADQDGSGAEVEQRQRQRQVSLSEGSRQAGCGVVNAEIQQERNLLADRLRDAEARADAASRSAQNSERRVLELKQNMSASSRVEKQISDQEIVEKMTRFNHEIQNWVVNTFRKVKTDSPKEMKKRFEDLPILIESNLLQSAFSNFDTGSKLFALQGTVVYLMMRVFEDDYFFGLPEGLRSLRASAEILKSSTSAYNEWRSQTFLLLQRAEGELRDAIDAATGKRKGKLIHDISSVLSILTKTELTKSQLTSLDRIVQDAITLSQVLSIQRAVYKCILPDCDAFENLAFDPEIMEDVFDAEDDDPGRTIRCITFPAVLKAGDESGDNMNLENVVLKGKALCHAVRCETARNKD